MDYERAFSAAASKGREINHKKAWADLKDLLKKSGDNAKAKAEEATAKPFPNYSKAAEFYAKADNYYCVLNMMSAFEEGEDE